MENEEIRHFSSTCRTLMTEEEKAEQNIPISDLSYDFACRITMLYKYLNEGKLSKADRDIIGAYGLQMIRSASSVSANLNEAKHPQSDADFLSKVNISLKEARETEHWLKLLKDTGYLDDNQHSSLQRDLDRILRILVTIVNKVSTRLKSQKRK